MIPSPGNQPETDRIQSARWILQDPIRSGIGLVDLRSDLDDQLLKVSLKLVFLMNNHNKHHHSFH
jgi:hypothetical protein